MRPTKLILTLLMCLVAQGAWANITTGLIDEWRMNESAGTTLKDSGSAGNNATTNASWGSPGKVSWSYLMPIGSYYTDYNGSSQYASAALSLSTYNQITLAFWLYWTSFDNNDELAFEYSVNYGSHAGSFLVDPSSGAPESGYMQVGINVGSTENIAAYTRPSGGVWHHYVILFDGTQASYVNEIALYIDGVLQAQQAGNGLNGAGSFGNYTLYFMSRAGASLWGTGHLSDVRIYNRLLSSSDITQLYNYTSSYYTSTIQTAKLTNATIN